MTAIPPRPRPPAMLPLLLLLLWVPLASAWSFNISSRVAQCANLSVTWDGGVAPWEVVLVPVGQLASGPEIRTIVDANVTSGNSYSFQLKFPTGSSFLAMMSDATGVGTGGTSDLITVLDGSADCLATSASAPLFYLYLAPDTSPAECSSLNVGWQAANSEGPVRITAMLPGGTSFALPVPSTGSSFNWTVDMRQGTEFLIVAGDQRGFGTGGSSELTSVAAGSSGCINGASPSSTAAPAAGGIYATGSGGGSVTGVPGGQPQQSGVSGSSSSKTSNVDAIIGGVVGGIAALLILLLLILFFIRRRRLREGRATTKGRKRDDVDLLHDEPGGAGTGRSGEEAALAAGAAAGGMRESGYNRNASISSVADTNTTGLQAPMSQRDRRSSAPSIPPLNFGRPSSDHGDTVSSSLHQPTTARTSTGVPPSAFFNSSAGGRPTTPTSTSGARRSAADAGGKGAMPAMRPVNVIVHDDAGHVPQAGGSQSPTEVVELPPSYADVRNTDA